MTTAVAEPKVTKLPKRVEETGNPLLGMLGQLATNPNFNAEAFREVVALIREERAGTAKAEFNRAFAAMQAELPPAPKRGTGHNNKKYARYEDIDAVAKPVLAKHGLSIGHQIHQDDTKMRIVAVLRHIGGHQETTEIVLPLDASGSKNAVQAHGSTTSYGKRYTYAALIGMSTEDDDDGQAASGNVTITSDELETLRSAIEFSGANVEKFKRHFKIPDLSQLPQSRFSEAMELLKRRTAS